MHTQPRGRTMAGLALALVLAAWWPAAQACGPYTVWLFDLGRLHYRDAQGKPAGIDPDLVKALAERSGCTLRTELDSRVRIWQRLRDGAMDLTLAALHTPERAELADLWPYMQLRNYVMLRPSQAVATPTAAAFLAQTDRKVVVVKGFVHGAALDAWLQALREQRRVTEVGDYPSAQRLFRAGRMDAMITSAASLTPADGMGTVSLMDWAGSETQPLPVHVVAARSRVSAPDRERLRLALQSLRADGSVDAILRRHLPPDQARALALPNRAP